MTTAPTESTVTLNVALLGREFKVVCKASEQTELEDAVAYLEAQMRSIRDAGKVAAIDRVAVMAALNLAHELLRTRRTAQLFEGDRASAPVAIDDTVARGRIQAMQSAVDAVLAGSESAR